MRKKHSKSYLKENIQIHYAHGFEKEHPTYPYDRDEHVLQQTRWSVYGNVD